MLAAYLDAEPDDISISGTLAETGVDETAVITFKYSDGRVGVAACNARAQLHNEGRAYLVWPLETMILTTVVDKEFSTYLWRWRNYKNN